MFVAVDALSVEDAVLLAIEMVILVEGAGGLGKLQDPAPGLDVMATGCHIISAPE